jgi:hypothetical protein
MAIAVATSGFAILLEGAAADVFLQERGPADGKSRVLPDSRRLSAIRVP